MYLDGTWTEPSFSQFLGFLAGLVMDPFGLVVWGLGAAAAGLLSVYGKDQSVAAVFCGCSLNFLLIICHGNHSRGGHGPPSRRAYGRSTHCLNR
jgi:hypothetical protein